MKLFYILIISFFCVKAFAQAPSISYNTPQVYSVNVTISPLSPTNTGGTVQGGAYGTVSTVAGTGRPGFVNGLAASAKFNAPRDVAIAVSGNIYVVEDNNVIRKITPAGIVSTFAGTGAIGSADGPGATATFSNPCGITTDPAGNLYVVDTNNEKIRKITPDGMVSTIAGNGTKGAANGPGATASFDTPIGIAIDPSGNLYIADSFNFMVRKITPSGIVSTVAGIGTYGYNDGPAMQASFTQVEDVVIDAAGNLYASDIDANKIRKITPDGMVSTFAGSGSPAHVDGVGTAASFNIPISLTIDVVGNIYVGDIMNQAIRKITPKATVTTIAGPTDGPSNNYGYVDGVGSVARFAFPYGMGTDGGNIYIADNQNSVIRKISLTGYTISPNLPAGLVFNPENGTISGTPTATSPATNYTVTAYNSFGSSVTLVNIEVNNHLPQVITFPAITSKTYGNADFNASATSSNNTLPLSYISSNPAVATIDATGVIHIIGAGTTSITVSQAGDNNYANATPVSQTLTVNPAALIVTADSKVKTYGSPNPTLTCTYAGFVNNETVAALPQPPLVTTTATAASNAGSYVITPGGAASGNYVFTYNTGELTITTAQLAVTANNQVREYGQANPPLTVSYEGFANGDTEASLSVQPSVATTANTLSSPGSYIITVSAAQSSNYNITFNTGILVVNKAKQIITFNQLPAKIIGDADFLLTASVNTGLPVTYLSSDNSIVSIINGNEVQILLVGGATITASQSGNDNYEPASAQQVQVINSKDITMANTFTPNNDGVNDTWKISGLETDATALISVFNRWGSLVFQSKGYPIPWNGTYQGKPLPFGTYYYIIAAKNNSQILKGNVTIVY